MFAHPAVATSMAFGVGAKAARRGIRRRKPPICVPKAIYAVTVCTYAEKKKKAKPSERKADKTSEIYVSYVNNNIFLQLT